MADELTTILTDGAQALEDSNRLAGNVQDPSVVDPAGTLANPEGSTPTGGATDNTITEQAPASGPPATNVTQEVPPPTVDETGSSGGLGGTSTTTEAPQQPTVEQTAVAQSDPTLGTPNALAPGEAPDNPPTVAVLPGTPDVPPDGGTIGDPSDDDDVYNDQLRDDPNLTLPPGAVAELGLETGFGTLATTRGTIVVNDPDGINDIATVTIAGRTYALADLYVIDPANPLYQIDLEASDGDDISEGTLVLERFDPATGEIFFRFDLKTPVDNDGTDNPNINQNSAVIPLQVTVTDLAGATATADGGIRIVDATPDVVTSAVAGAPDPFVSDDDALGTPISNNFADNFEASFNPGSDGESTRSSIYDLSIGGDGRTGLFDLQGREIVLVEENGVITGVAGGVPMFTVSVDAAGNVTLTQLQPLQHLNAEGQPNDSLSLPAGLINLTRTDSLSDTDGDTDVSSATIEISSGFTFLDSVPNLSVNGVEGASTQLSTALDETQGNTDRYATGESSDAFVNQDLAGAVATSQTSIVGGIEQLFAIGGDPGADGLKSQTGTLSFAGIPEGSSIATQLVATDGGAVRLVLKDGAVVGLDTDGDTVLTIELVVLNGVTQLRTTQYEALNQPNGEAANLYDNSVALLLTGGDVLQILYTVVRTDGDLDVIERQATIELADANSSLFSFDDDGITAQNDAFQVKEGGKVSGNVLFNDGANASGTDGYAENPIANPGIYEATDAEGNPVGVLTLNPDGSFEFSAYPNAIKADTVVTFDVVTKDADGDSVTTQLAITLRDQSFVVTDDDAIVDESFLPGGNQDPDGGNSSFTGNISGDSANGPLSFALEGGASTLEGVYGTLTLDSKTGEYTYRLNENYLADGEGRQVDDGVESFNYTVTDSLGNASTGVIEVAIQDDVPEQVVTAIDATFPSALEVSLDETVGSPDPVKGSEVANATSPNATDDVTGALGQQITAVSGGLSALFTATGEYGADAFDGQTAGVLSLVLSGTSVATNLVALNGGAVTLSLDVDGDVVGKDTTDQVVLRIEIDGTGANAQLKTTLYEALKTTDNTKFDESTDLRTTDGTLSLKYEVTRTDGDKDVIVASDQITLSSSSDSVFAFQDDGPRQTVTAIDATFPSALEVSLDETVGSPDPVKGSEVANATSPNATDDVTGALGQQITAVSGGLSALFTATGEYGADAFDGQTAGVLSLVLSGTSVATNLVALNGGAVTLSLDVDGDVVGKDTTDQVVLRIEIDGTGANAQLKTTLYEALKTTDNTKFDESTDLRTTDGTLSLKYEVTRTDGDKDVIVASDQITLSSSSDSVFAFQDDGPRQTVTAIDATFPSALEVSLDETVGSPDPVKGSEVANATSPNATDDVTGALGQQITAVSGGLSALFTATGEYGADAFDGQTAGVLSLVLSGTSVATNLVALNGGAVTLSLDVDGDVVGKDTTDQVVLRIEIDGTGANAQLKTTLYEALKTTDNTKFDESTDLRTTDGTLSLKYEVTRTDGDKDVIVASDQITLSSSSDSVFAFQDDGPRQTVTAIDATFPSALEVSLDETVGSPDPVKGSEVANATSPNATDDVTGALGQQITAVSGGLSALFTATGEYGADAFDGQTAGVLSLVLSGTSVATNLVALNGGAVTLSLDVDGDVVGKDTTDQVVLRIEIDGTGANAQLKTTLYEALKTTDNTKFDESTDLRTTDGTLSLKYEVTRTDGDKDVIVASDQITLSSSSDSVFAFQDDGPRQTVTAIDATFPSALEVSLDETVGSPDPVKGSEVANATSPNATDDVTGALGQQITAVSGGLSALFTATGEYGADAFDGQTAGVLSLVLSGTSVATNLVALNGGAVTLSLDVDGDVVGKDTTDQVVLRIEIDGTGANAQLKTTLYEALKTTDNTKFDESTDLRTTDGTLSLKYEVTRTDGDKDVIVASDQITLSSSSDSVFAFQDDGPRQTVTAIDATFPSALEVSLDETVGSPDPVKGSEVANATSPNATDDVTGALGQQITAVSGGLSALFTATGEYGADAFDGQTAGVLSLVLSGTSVATNLVALNGGAVTLSLDVDGDVVGKDTTDQVVLRIEIDGTGANAQLKTTLYEALKTTDNTKFDESTDLRTTDGTLSLKYEVTRTDGDKDVIVASDQITLSSSSDSVFAFQDDGPRQTVTAIDATFPSALEVSLDETVGSPDPVKGSEVANATSPNATDDVTGALGQQITAVSGGLSALFTATGEYGADAFDGQTAGVLSLVLSGTSVATNLVALNGGAVTLSLDVDGDVVGKDTTDQVVLRIEIDGTGANAQLKTTLYEALKTTDNTKFDESTDLRTTDGTLSLKYEVTRTDGDKDVIVASDQITLSSSSDSVFAFQDDGPRQTVTAIDATFPSALEVSLDETVGSPDPVKGSEVANATSPNATDDVTGALGQQITAVSGGLSALFTATGEYGADAFDGQTAGVLSLVLSGTSVATNLVALNGGAVTLSLDVDGDVVGKDTTDQVVLRIEIDGTGANAQLKTTLYEALKTTDNTKFDESTDLRTTDGTLSLKYEVTRTDGDKDVIVASDQITLSSSSDSVFAFQDDGPRQTVTAIDATFPSALEVSLDETVGSPDPVKGSEVANATSPNATDDVTGALGQQITAVSGGLSALFTATGEYGADAFDGQTAGVLSLVLSGTSVATNLVALNGGAVTLSLDVDGDVVGKDTTDQVVLRIEIDGTGANAQLKTTLYEALKTTDNTKFDESTDLRTTDGTLSLKYEVTRTDGDKDVIVASDQITLSSSSDSVFAFQDDGPRQTVTAIDATFPSALEVSLDETVGSPDPVKGSEVANATSPNATDDVTGALGQQITAVSGGLSALFTATGEYGADAFDGQTAGVLSLVLSGTSVATNLVALNGGAVTLSLDVDGDVVGKDTTDQVVLRIEIDGTGANAQLKTTLYEALKTTDNTKFDESTDLRTTDGTLSLKYEVTRTDGDKDVIVASDQITLSSSSDSVFAFQDDGPRAIFENSRGTVSIASSVITGYWTGDQGADSSGIFYDGSLTTTDFFQSVVVNSISVNGSAVSASALSAPTVVYLADGTTVSYLRYVGTYTYDNPSDSQPAAPVSYTLDIFAGGTYQLSTTIPAGTKTFDTANDSLKLQSGGPVNSKVYTVTDSVTGDTLDIQFSTTAPNGINVSGQGVGINNNILEYDKGLYETVTIDPLGTDVVKAINLLFTGTGQQLFAKSQGDALYIEVWEAGADPNGSPTKTITLQNLDLKSYAVDSDALGISSIDKVAVTVNSTTTNLKMAVGVVVQNSVPVNPVPVNFDFTATVADAEGDSVASSFSVLVSNAVAPVSLDLDRSGAVDYVEAGSASGYFDLSSGLAFAGAVSSSDGLLAYDYNQDGSIAHAKELVFTMWGDGNPDVATDMQALAAYFDSDENGVFNSDDAMWDYFGVWQDLNTDGVQQQGEFNSLEHWGIESIALSYDADSQAYSAADGDVQVYGQMTVSYEDGTSGLAEDMAFAVQSSVATADTSLASTAEPVFAVDELVTSYLDSMASSGDTDGSGDLSVAELAYGLDHLVSDFIDNHGFSMDDHAVIQQEVYNQLAHDLNDLSVDDGIDIAFDDAGDANGAEVLAALDHHFMDIHDAHVVPVDSYDDPGSMV